MPTQEGDLSGNPVGEPAEGSQDQQAETTPEVRVGVSRPRFTISSVVMSAIAILAVLVAAYFLYKLLPVLLLVFVSILFATAIEPLVTWLRRGPFNRAAGILVVYTSIFLLVGLLGFLLVPVFLNQVSELGQSLPNTIKSMRSGAEQIESPFVKQQALSWVDAADSLVQQFAKPAPASNSQSGLTNDQKVQAVTQTTLGVAEVFFSVITFFVVAFYWLTERPLIKRAVTSWFTAKRANRIRRVWDEVEYKVGGWVRGQLTLMLIIGAASAVGYFLIGVEYWPAMALFIGLCEAIPLVGPYIGTAPAVLIALTQASNDGLPALAGMGDMGSVTRALLVVAFAIILQTVEGNVLVPRVMRNSVGISPLAVIISLLIGAALGGLLGALLAVPIAGSIQVILSDIRNAHEEEAKIENVVEDATHPGQEAVEVVVANKAAGPAGT